MHVHFHTLDKSLRKNCAAQRNQPDQQIFFFFNHTATPEIYTSVHTLSLHDALPISVTGRFERRRGKDRDAGDSPSGAPCHDRSEEHTSELQSRTLISYAVFCLK